MLDLLDRLLPSLLLALLAPLIPSPAAGQPQPLVLAVGFSDAALAARPVSAEPLAAQDTRAAQAAMSSSATFANVAFSAGLLGGLGAVAGGLVAASLDDTSDGLGAVLQGVWVGAWVGGAVGGAAASGRPGPAILGSAMGVLPAIAMLDVGGPSALLLGPLTHGVVTALFTQLIGPPSQGQ